MLDEAQINIESLVKAELPPLPSSILKVSGLLQDDNVSPRTIADAISYDPMLVVKILRMANSPIYALQRNITTLTQAVVAVGNKAIYEMVMIGATTDAFSKEIRSSVIGRENWVHSIAVAIIARELCVALNMRGSDEAFICGLLHDVGKILLLRADNELYTELHSQTDENELPIVEKEVFGFGHSQVGALAAHRWGLPDPICHMIMNHHLPVETEQALFMTYIVNIADGVSHVKARGLEAADHRGLLRPESLETLGITFDQLEDVWEKSVPNLQEIIQTFS